MLSTTIAATDDEVDCDLPNLSETVSEVEEDVYSFCTEPNLFDPVRADREVFVIGFACLVCKDCTAHHKKKIYAGILNWFRK